MRLGVDFGTTHTVVAMPDRGNYPVVSFADQRGDVHEFFPSVVAEQGGRLFHGWEAQALEGAPGATVVRSFKRLLGAKGASPHGTVQVGALRVPLVELVSGFLAAVKAAIPGAEGRVPTVVAVPANAHGTQRFATISAFQHAGFDVVGLVNEPSAAGFEYTHRHRSTLNSKRDRIVVYDLGGGTFDASLVRIAARRHEVLATAGLNQLGGDDFDLALADLALARAGASGQPLDAGRRLRLVLACREAKEALTPNSRKITLDLEDALGAGAWPAEVSFPVDAFYEAVTPLVAQSIEAMRPVISTLDAEEQGTRENLAGLYVVGGASALPVVGRVLREQFGRRVHRSPYPFAAVAIGLAIAADRDSGYELEDRLSRHFGVFREARAGEEIVFDSIFARDVVVPREGERVSLARRYRASHNVGHYRFAEVASVDDHGEPRGDLTPFGEVFFPFDPRLRGAADLGLVEVRRTAHGPMVEERYTVDPRGLVTVEIADLDTGYAQAHTLGA